jgi:hypothetical protein
MPGSVVEAAESLKRRLSVGSAARFESLYLLDLSEGAQVVPESFAPKVKRWFRLPTDQDEQQAIERAQQQRVLSVTNRRTFEATQFNYLRAMRPIPLSSDVDTAKVEEEIERCKSTCDFCQPLSQTAADPFGRVESKYCLTASNVAKAFASHGLILFREHHPVKALSEEAVTDALQTAQVWMEKMMAKERLKNGYRDSFFYPTLYWNCLRKAGASQAHGHLQPVLAQGGSGWPGKGGLLAHAARCHEESTGRDYFQDLIWAHEQMGLARKVGENTYVLAHLSPLKEKEILVVGPAFDDEFTHAFYIALHTLIHKLDVKSFNCCIYMPRMGAESSSGIGCSGGGGEESGGTGIGVSVDAGGVAGHKRQERAPNLSHVMARLVDRGNAAASTTDIASMELYGASIVSTDPCTVARSVDATLKATPCSQASEGRGATRSGAPSGAKEGTRAEARAEGAATRSRLLLLLFSSALAAGAAAVCAP